MPSLSKFAQMIRLVYKVVGDKGEVSSLHIDSHAWVAELKEMIAAKERRKITCDASDLRLFLAKQKRLVPATHGAVESQPEEQWEWMPYDHATRKALQHGERPDIKAIIEGKRMLAASEIGDVLATDRLPLPSSDQVHILVVLPTYTIKAAQHCSSGLTRLFGGTSLPGLGLRRVSRHGRRTSSFQSPE